MFWTYRTCRYDHWSKNCLYIIFRAYLLIGLLYIRSIYNLVHCARLRRDNEERRVAKLHRRHARQRVFAARPDHVRTSTSSRSPGDSRPKASARDPNTSRRHAADGRGLLYAPRAPSIGHRARRRTGELIGCTASEGTRGATRLDNVGPWTRHTGPMAAAIIASSTSPRAIGSSRSMRRPGTDSSFGTTAWSI